MNHRQRFYAVMNYDPFDRIPLYFFGTWYQTKQRWKQEGLDCDVTPVDAGPQVPGMDPDWEPGLWDSHGLTNIHPICQAPPEALQETDDFIIEKYETGAIVKKSKRYDSIYQDLEYALKPTRSSWREFKKRFLSIEQPQRRPEGWQIKAEILNHRQRVAALLGGSLFGFPRNWMGLEALSYLPIDDPVLFEEILDYYTDFIITLYKPILQIAKFDFVYIFEDCCCNTGPLLSPNFYKKFYHKYYQRLFDFYKTNGIPFILLDSDGKIDALVPLWLETGVDILFPIEVGTWQSDPARFRQIYGKKMRMMGGINKHTIVLGETAIRKELTHLKPLVGQGGYIPMPDHRIPPDCSLENFLKYIEVFKEIFGFST